MSMCYDQQFFLTLRIVPYGGDKTMKTAGYVCLKAELPVDLCKQILYSRIKQKDFVTAYYRQAFLDSAHH